MKVKIIQCTPGKGIRLDENNNPIECEDFYPWYKDKIGKKFQIDTRFSEEGKGYFYSPVYITWVNGKEHGIKKQDCEIVGD